MMARKGGSGIAMAIRSHGLVEVGEDGSQKRCLRATQGHQRRGIGNASKLALGGALLAEERKFDRRLLNTTMFKLRQLVSLAQQ